MPSNALDTAGPSRKTRPEEGRTQTTNKARCNIRAEELLNDRTGARPVWVRAPKSGVEFYSGSSRAKLYEWAGKGFIRSVSIREPGQIKGCRLFNLESILAFIDACEKRATERSGEDSISGEECGQ